MKRRVVVLGDTGTLPAAVKAKLRRANYSFESRDVMKPTLSWSHDLFSFDVVLVLPSKRMSARWAEIHKVLDKLPHAALVYILPDQHTKLKSIIPTELLAVVRASDISRRLLGEVERVARVRDLLRKLDEEKTRREYSDDKLFMERLDANHILDRMLQHYGQWVEAANLHWILWSEFETLLTKDRSHLALEMEIHRGLHTPNLRALRDCQVEKVLTHLLQSFTPELVGILKNEDSCVWTDQGQTQMAVIVRDPEGTALGVLWFQDLRDFDAPAVIPSLKESLGHIGRYVGFGLAYWDARSQAMHDDLTGLFNQRFLRPVLAAEVARSTRHKLEFTVLFLDMDRFKQVNDKLGHWVGSALLKEVGKLIKMAIRTCDFGFRYGGDEFVVILPETPKQGGHVVAERLRKAVEDARFVIDGQELQMTASVGVASFPADAKTLEDVLKMADSAMYLGKRGSRNVVYLAG